MNHVNHNLITNGVILIIQSVLMPGQPVLLEWFSDWFCRADAITDCALMVSRCVECAAINHGQAEQTGTK